MIQTYFGNGKGKTTAAVGSAIRFAGCENKVLYAEFLKNNASSELTILKCMKNVEVLSSDECYNLFDNLKEERTKDLTCAYTKLLQCVKEKAGSVKMIVLDEVLDALDFNYLDEDEFINVLEMPLTEAIEKVMNGEIKDSKTQTILLKAEKYLQSK